MPLVDVAPFLEESTPAADYLKEKLKIRDICLVTDKHTNPTYTEAQRLMADLEQKYHTILLHDLDIRQEVEDLLGKITKNATVPHLFYKQQYFGSGNRIEQAYARGELETMLGLEPIIVH